MKVPVSEFFAKNQHLLGFDNPRKALLTTVKEAVDNSLDACEEGGILPEVWIHIESVGKDKYKIGVQDNGPGIVKKQIPLIFGKQKMTFCCTNGVKHGKIGKKDCILYNA